MPEALKTFFSLPLVRRLAKSIANGHPGFPSRAFVRQASKGLDELEFMDRGRQIARTLAEHLPLNYPEAVDILLKSLGPEHSTDELRGVGMAPFFYLPHAIFIAERGLSHFDLSMLAQYELTKRFTAEASIRGYIAQDPERAFRYLRKWATDSNPHVRRLVSEGTRLRLPWAARVPWLDRNPARVIELLDMLKDDPTTLVRRSVANSLNDLSKVHRPLTTQVCREWLREATRERRKLVEHALRSAVKNGDTDALRVLGYGTRPVIQIEEVTITPKRATIGQTVHVSIALRSKARTDQELLVDLVVHFPGVSGKSRRKVFKLKRVLLPASGVVRLSSRVSLAVYTTRKPFPGVHTMEALINGTAMPIGGFSVKAG